MVSPTTERIMSVISEADVDKVRLEFGNDLIIQYMKAIRELCPHANYSEYSSLVSGFFLGIRYWQKYGKLEIPDENNMGVQT